MLFIKSLIGILPILFVLAEIILAKTEREREWKYIPVTISAVLLLICFMLYTRQEFVRDTVREAWNYILIALIVSFLSACTGYFSLRRSKHRIRDLAGAELRFYLLFSGILFAACEISMILTADLFLNVRSARFTGYFATVICFIVVSAVAFALGMLYKRHSKKRIKDTYLALIALFVPVITYVLNRCIYDLFGLMSA